MPTLQAIEGHLFIGELARLRDNLALISSEGAGDVALKAMGGFMDLAGRLDPSG
jgi:hypothetical protein